MTRFEQLVATWRVEQLAADQEARRQARLPGGVRLYDQPMKREANTLARCANALEAAIAAEKGKK